MITKNNILTTERTIQGLFPIPVQTSKIPFNLSAKEKEELLSYETKNNHGNLVSKETYILKKNKTLKKLHEWFLQEVKVFKEDILCPTKDFEFYITQSWINKSRKGQWHHKHRHPNSVLSGVFFIQSNEGDRILFGRDEIYRQIDTPVKEDRFNPFNSLTWWVGALEGLLLIFPSGLAHEVPPVEGNKERVSMSFNTWFKGYMGDDDSLTGLHL